MKKIPFIIQLILLSALWSGCVKDSFRALLPEEGTARLHFRVKIPSTGSSSLSRAVQEEGLNQVSLLVLENTGNGFQYQYAVSGYSIQESTTADYEFLARILLSANPLRIYLVANVSGATDPLTLGMSEEEVKEALTEDFTASGFSGFLPMSGVLDFPDGISGDATAPVTSLIRSVARVDVINSAGNFTLTSVRVYRAMDLLQVIPDRTTDHTVTAVSVPAGALPQIDTVPVEAEDNSVQASVYIPESDITPSSDRLLGSTAVVIGGIYEGSGVTTYYRLDFVPDDDRQDLFGQVLRNHLYRFHITEVQVPGWSTDDEAAVNPSSQIQAEIVVWNEEDLYMVFDGIDHFGVSRRTVRLGYSAGASAEVSVDTSLESYRAYWG
ncbi:MAG: hypothetical protein LUD68_05490, partial [Rikenellaceae bacterium]|nr:hypothetical protein [Rikenellaceae bacterium]